jgi:hypothetical protein
VRIGVKRGSVYDLFLTRTLQQATVIRGAEGTEVFVAEGLQAGAGIREPVTEFVIARPGYRLIPGRFMEIQQAVGTARAKRPETIKLLHGLVEELKASGFVAEALRRSGQSAPVAPPAPLPSHSPGMAISACCYQGLFGPVKAPASLEQAAAPVMPLLSVAREWMSLGELPGDGDPDAVAPAVPVALAPVAPAYGVADVDVGASVAGLVAAPTAWVPALALPSGLAEGVTSSAGPVAAAEGLTVEVAEFFGIDASRAIAANIVLAAG